MKSSVLSTCSFCRSYSALRALDARGALDDVLVVAERVADELAVLELDDLAADRADEGAVVRDQHERPRVLGEEGLEPLDRGEVEVVGRLVEQQQIGLAHEHLGQLQPAALAARQRVDRAREIALGEPDVGGEALDPRLELVAALALVALLQLAVAGELVGLPVGEPRLERRQLVVQPLQIGERLEQRVEQRAAPPTAPATGAGRRRTCAPSTRTSPLSASRSPASRRSAVDLPVPFGPSSASRSPGRISSEAPTRMSLPG